MEMKKIAVVLASVILLTSVSIIVAQDVDVPEGAPDDFPEELSMDLEVQSAYNDDEVFFNFRWETEEPYWHHDYFVYEDGEWTREGFTEDRLRIMFGNEDLKGYRNFGGWITGHDGMRGFENEVPPEDVEAHPWLGEELGEDDVRKYIPQSREGEWWEAEWDEVKSEEELDEMMDNDEFLDLWTWRAHRSNPVDAATDHYILEYRHDDEGEQAYYSQDMDPEEGPQYMFDTDHEDIDEPVLKRDEIEDLKDGYDNQEDIYYLLEEYTTEFDEEVIEGYDIDLEDAAMPRRVLTEPTDSAGAVEADGYWDEDTTEWNVELSRELDTGYEDDIPIEEGEEYTICFSPGKSEVSGRWHHSSYPIAFSLDQGTDDEVGGEVSGIEAEEFDGDEPDWDEKESHTITCIYPGHTTWQWIIDQDHTGMYMDIKNDETSKWDLHPDPEDFVEVIVEWEHEEGIYVEDDIEIIEFTVNGEEEDVQIDIDDETVVYAEVENNLDEEVEMIVEILEDGEDIRGPHDYSETIAPGTTGEIEEIYDPHPPGWYEGEFEVNLEVDGEVLETIDVTVGDPDVDPDEVDWDDVRFMGGMIIAAFIIGFGAGFLLMKKKTDKEEE